VTRPNGPLGRDAEEILRRLEREAAGTHSDLYRDHLASNYWHALRHGILWRADNRCERCGAGGRLDVHHFTYERLGCENLWDVAALCRDCHALADAARVETERRRRVDSRWTDALIEWAETVEGPGWRLAWWTLDEISIAMQEVDPNFFYMSSKGVLDDEWDPDQWDHSPFTIEERLCPKAPGPIFDTDRTARAELQRHRERGDDGWTVCWCSDGHWHVYRAAE
jgi:hypothetical protein